MKNPFSPALLKKYIYPALLVLFAVAFLVSAGFLADYYIKSFKQKKLNQQLSQMIQPEVTGTDSLEDYTNEDITGDFTLPPQSKYTKVVHPKTNKTLLILTEYLELFNLNPDLIGWINISGTNINYPVMHTPNWVNYYLTRDFYGQKDKHGALYADEMANLRNPSDNITIYGHRMQDGTMFADLHDYKSWSFYKEHSIIDFDTIYEKHTYEIFAVFLTTATTDGFAYHQFVDGTEEDFNAYVAKCKELSIYNTGVNVSYGDKLITLSTCEHAFDEGRLAVVAKRIS